MDLFAQAGYLLAHVHDLVGFGAFGQVEHGLAFFELIGKFLELVFHEFFLLNDLVEERHGLVEFGAAVFEGLFELFVFGGGLGQFEPEGFLEFLVLVDLKFLVD